MYGCISANWPVRRRNQNNAVALCDLVACRAFCLITQLPGLVSLYGPKALIVKGARSFLQSPCWDALAQGLSEAGVAFEAMTVSGEPSPKVVDAQGIDGRPQFAKCSIGDCKTEMIAAIDPDLIGAAALSLMESAGPVS